MKKLLSIVILLLVAVLMVLTRPSMEAHKEAMMKVVDEYVEEETRNTIGINLFSRLGQNVIVQTAVVLLDTKLQLHDYYLFSTTSVELDGKDQQLSFGIFGYVFTFDKEMLREKINAVLKRKSGKP